MNTADGSDPGGPSARLPGREAELEAIEAHLALAAGSDRVLVLLGDPGIGKSALLREARSLAGASGRRVLSTTGAEAESHIPFAALQQLLTTLELGLDSLETDERDALLVCFGLAEGNRPDTFLIARAASRVLNAASRVQPTILVIDDLQWIDAESMSVLAFIARSAVDEPLAILAAARSGYHLPAFSGHMRTVGPVNERAAEDILDTSAPDLDVAARRHVLSASAGNPLALLELPTTVTRGPLSESPEARAASLPDRLERAFTARLSDVPQLTRDAVLVLALNATDDLGEVLPAARAFTRSAVTIASLAPAVDVGLLRASREGVSFRHPLVRSGILRAEPLERRQAAHRALAETLNEPNRRVWHVAQSIVGPDDGVATSLEESARTLANRGALEAAITRLERSADLTTNSGVRGRRLLAAAQHAFELGRADLVHALVEKARQQQLSDLEGARLQWLREILHDGNPGDATRVLELAEWARRSAAADDMDLALDLLLGAGLRCWWADTGPQARLRVIDVLDELAQDSDPRFVAALAVTEPVLRGQQVSDLLSLPRFAVSRHEDGDSLRLLGMAAHAIGDSPRAAVLLDAAEDILRRRGQQGLLAHVLSMQVIIRLELGDLAGAIRAVDEGLLLADLTGQPIWNTGTLVCAARVEAMRGNTQKAFDLATQAELAAGRAQLNDLLACVAMAQGLAHLDWGDSESAYLSFRSLFEPSSPHFHQRERFDGVMFLARAALLSGQVADARSFLDDLEQVAAVTPSPLLHAHLLYARPALAEQEQRERLFRAGLSEDLSAWPWVLGQLRLCFGQWLLVHDRPAEAVEHLEMCMEAFDKTGAVLWAEQARATLARAIQEAANA